MTRDALVREFLALHDGLTQGDPSNGIDMRGIELWERLRLALVREGIHVEHLLHARRLTAGEQVIRLEHPVRPQAGVRLVARGSLAVRIRRIMQQGVA